MTIDLKSLVKQYVTLDPDNTSAVVNLDKVQDGEWQLSRKAEYKSDVYSIPETDLFLEIRFARSGNYHSGYTYVKPQFSIVTKKTEQVVSYPDLPDSKEKADALKSIHFDENDDTKLTPVYTSGWGYGDKVNSYESVYDIDGVLFKQTMYGNSDWTEIVDYAIVQRQEETVVSYKKLNKFTLYFLS